MRKLLVPIVVMLAMLPLAGPAVGRERALDVDTRAVDFGTIAAPGDVVSDAITITNTTSHPVVLDLVIDLKKPRSWAEPWSPFIVEDLGIPPSWEPCNPLPAGESCVVYLTFQTDRAGTFTGTLLINGAHRVRLRGTAA